MCVYNFMIFPYFNIYTVCQFLEFILYYLLKYSKADSFCTANCLVTGGVKYIFGDSFGYHVIFNKYNSNFQNEVG